MAKNIHLIAAARPNFMKVAPLYHALRTEDWCRPILVHTGQHYDFNMSGSFFSDLALPEPDFNLEIGSGTHAEQTAAVMVKYEQLALTHRPDLVVVVGDVNSTVACTIAAKKIPLPVAHLEAGLRSGDMGMPEEVNRVLTDAVADFLWTPSRDADENLLRAGVPPERIAFVGNIMMDSFEMLRPKIEVEATARKLGLAEKEYAVVTLHRPSNVDNSSTLGKFTQTLLEVADRLPLAFAIHPRTRSNLEKFDLMSKLSKHPRIKLLEPLNYVRFMSLLKSSRMAITDSGGIQEETTYLGVPCLTLRETTERPITIWQGTNQLLKDSELIAAVDNVLTVGNAFSKVPELWDGKTALRIVKELKRIFNLI